MLITRYRFLKKMSRSLLFGLGTAILCLKWCFLVFLMLSPASKIIFNNILAEKLDIFAIVYLNDILDFNKNLSKSHIDVIQWVGKQVWNHSLYAKLKKYCFHQNKVRFLGYIVLAKKIQIKEQIQAIKNWLKPKLGKDIQMFIRFAYFYC